MHDRIEFMYSYADTENDRHRVRERFFKHMNRKTTLEDIGLLLDKWVLDSKANTEFFSPEHHLNEQPASAATDVGSDRLYWNYSFLARDDPTKPNWMDDKT